MPSRVVQKTIYISREVAKWLEEKAKELFGDTRGRESRLLEMLLRREMEREKRRGELI